MQTHGTLEPPAQLVCPICHTTFASKSSNKTETCHGQSSSPLTKATIYDAQDLQSLPNPYTKLPSLRSWATFRDSRSINDKVTVSETDTNLDKSRMRPCTETRNEPKSSSRSASIPLAARYGDSIKKGEKKLKGETRGKTQGLDVASPRMDAAKLPKGKGQNTDVRLKLTQIYRSVREMQHSKPLGEGGAMLGSIKVCRRESQEYGLKQQPLCIEHEFTEPRKPPQPPTPASVAHPDPLQPRDVVLESAEKGNNTQTTHHSRKDSVISDGQVSLSSRDVPIVIDKKHMYPNLNKPLPPLPQPQPQPSPAPALTPLYRPTTNPTAPKETRTRTNLTNPPSPSIHIPPPPPQPQPNPPSKRNLQISHPTPLITSNNIPTANIALESSGAGGPAAAISLPFPRSPQHSSQVTEQLRGGGGGGRHRRRRRKGRHVAPLDAKVVASRHWREKLGGGFRDAMRRDSDVSFMCRGLEGVDVGFELGL